MICYWDVPILQDLILALGQCVANFLQGGLKKNFAIQKIQNEDVEIEIEQLYAVLIRVFATLLEVLKIHFCLLYKYATHCDTLP